MVQEHRGQLQSSFPELQEPPCVFAFLLARPGELVAVRLGAPCTDPLSPARAPGFDFFADLVGRCLPGPLH